MIVVRVSHRIHPVRFQTQVVWYSRELVVDMMKVTSNKPAENWSLFTPATSVAPTRIDSLYAAAIINDTGVSCALCTLTCCFVALVSSYITTPANFCRVS